MASALDGLRAKLQKKYEKAGIAETVFQVGVPADRFRDTFSLGSPSLDWMTYNSIPEGCFIEISGEEASGKTTLAFKIAADFIRKEKKKLADRQAANEKLIADFETKKQAAIMNGKKAPAAPEIVDYQIRHILFVDAEGTADPRWAKTSAGYDMNDEVVQTLYMTPLGQTAEQIFDDVRTAVSEGAIGLVIFDSLVAIAAQQVMNESMEKKMMGGIAAPLGDFVRRNTGIFNRFRCTFIGINGIYMDLSGYGNPERTPGGTYWKRACSLRLRTKKGKSFDEDGNELKDSENKAVGHYIQVALLKTKFCRWDRRLAICSLNYVRGLDILQDTIDVAYFFGIIQEPSKGYFNVIDPDTGEILVEKIHGKGNIKPYLEEHADVWKRIYDTVYIKMAEKDVPNTMSFESMLNLDVNTEMGFDLNSVDQESNIGE